MFYSLQQNGLEPDAVTFVAVLRVGRLDEAHNFSKQLGVEGNVLGRWGSLLAACRVHINFELGKIVSSKLLELEGNDGIYGYHILLSNIYAEVGNWQSFDNVRRGMRKMRLSKEVGCSWIDTSGYPHCFVSKDKKHPQYCMIYDMLGYLTINM
ncbi:hypothetical protein H5410_055480 [Solanum commersonii]|uniref:Pentatricopeptide repeat-containing protein n=1 Tax=Solanum commersonii TaxID=4109 RepID=A0A9J5WIF1_SOLCO|nr:hypothetical protein H5410_055480 [Solanum commersonii]